MAGCCEDRGCEITALPRGHGRVLWLVLLINAAMFLIEGAAGLFARSTSLLADALDMLGDALVSGFSLFVLARPARWQAAAALVKGLIMLAFGIGVFIEAGNKIWRPVIPAAETMGTIGAWALMANLICFILLYRHRGHNLNMRSTWLCTRNDLFANLGVIVAAGGSRLLASYWPDVAVGIIIAGLFLSSALNVLRAALGQLHGCEHMPAPPSPRPLSDGGAPRK